MFVGKQLGVRGQGSEGQKAELIMKEQEKRFEKLEKEIEHLKKEVSFLRQEVLRWQSTQSPSALPLLRALAQRGLTVLDYNHNLQFILKPDANTEHQDILYNLLRRYSFRLFMRDLIQFPRGKSVKRLCRYCSITTARSYLKTLQELGIVRVDSRKGYSLLVNGVKSFGPTLEWYVGQIFSRQFSAPVLTGVKFKDTPTGGDYDVIALLEQKLVYVEVKSSPPRGVEKPAVKAFLDRLGDLQPHVALFFVDTELRMKDKMVVLFTEEMERRLGVKASRDWPVKRMVDELFQINHGIYILNSKRGIVVNTKRCIRDFNRYYRLGQVRVPWSF